MWVLQNSGDVQGLKDLSPSPALCQVFEALCMHDRFQVEQSGLKQFIDYNVVKFSGLRHFVGGVLQAQLTDIGGVFAAVVQAGLQLLPAGGKDEDEHSIGEQLFDLNGALEVDFQNHISALGNAVFNGFARGAVALAVDVGPFQKRIALNHLVEF